MKSYRETFKQSARSLGALALLVFLSACSDQSTQTGNSTEPVVITSSNATVSGSSSSDNGSIEPQASQKVDLTPNADELAQFNKLQTSLEQQSEITAAQFQDANNIKFIEELSYDPSDSTDLSLLQDSPLALSQNELNKLNENGFVISTAKKYPTFLRGYADIYKYHLPIYVSADAILETVHQSYDAILLSFESKVILSELSEFLAATYQNTLASDVATKDDLLVYLGVARSLLSGEILSSENTEIAEDIAHLYSAAVEATALQTVELFGVGRIVDFSQFTPRGHYTSSSALSNYFRAMIWLGRIDFRMIETQSDGSTVFHRDQYDAMNDLHQLIDDSALERWQKIERILSAMIGESDYMTLLEVSSLNADLANQDNPSNEQIAQAIVDGGYGSQKIASHFTVIDKETPGGLSLNYSFALFGQRYIVDSEVFSNLVYDRLAASNSSQRRMLPDPLDAAFAALNNRKAANLLSADTQQYAALPAALSNTQSIVNSHDESFWGANLYNLWLSALRALSPSADLTQEVAEGLPEVAATEAWSRRMLNTQLGSWAQLRHDTLLYAKQSYTGVPGCEFPDAYIEPYPKFFAALEKYALQGMELTELVSDEALGASITAYFSKLVDTLGTLKSMAENQRRGEPHTEAQLAFINNAVRIEQENAICTFIDVPNGWYADLFYGDRTKSITFDPTIADVHTAPADATGATVGWVKHVATGYPRFTAVSVKNCNGVGIYSGMTYGYHELTSSNFKRFTDEEWAQRLSEGEPVEEVPWMQSLQAQ